jgi:hypothetical protein
MMFMNDKEEIQQGMCYVCKEIMPMTDLKFQFIPTMRLVAHVCSSCQKQHQTMDVDKFVPDGDVTL